ncbi:MAG: hypothetical protein BIFFINMI_00113 [Phycisphaerae bacterium]|nr:hypothetical protein [Phycisphaerae bacterium]
MKRASAVVFFAVAGLVLMGQLGCAQMDALKAENAACQKARGILTNDLRIANGKVDSLQRERDVALEQAKDSQGRIDDMMSKVQAANTENARLASANSELQTRLREAEERAKVPDVITVKEPGAVKLAPAVDEALKALAQRNGLEYDARLGLVRFSTDLLFDLGSTKIRPEVEKSLAEFARVINMDEAKQYDVIIAGHTDDVRIAKPETLRVTPTNWHLSAYRACAVLLDLQKDGVSADRMSAMGFGETRPRVANKGRGGTPENRRVEVFLVPKGSVASAG